MLLKRNVWNWLILFSLLMMLMAVRSPQPAQAQTPGVNLLRNGDFEEGDITWPMQDGIPEVQIAPGWRGFYVDNPPAYAVVPYACMDKPNCSYWRRPEFRDVKSGEFAYRVHQGWRAQKYFSFSGQHEAGLYQQVSGITPGTPLRFTAHMMTWSCMASAEQWNVCPTGHLSNNPAPMHTKVGIDPTGGTNPWAGTVIWSPEISAIDTWTLFAVEAQAVNSTVTVFTYSRANWHDYIFRVHNDVYVDTAALVVIGETPETPAPPPPTQESPVDVTPVPTPTPAATPPPRSDGAVVHIVSSGDTLSAIARRYNVPADQIIALNNIANPSILVVGQELVISRPGGVVAPPPQPTVAPTETPSPTPVDVTTPITLPLPTQEPSEPLPVALSGQLCLLAYSDSNADGVRQPEEPLLPGVTFTIQGDNQPLLYTTTGIQEPFCFTDLPVGTYQVIAQVSAADAAMIANAYSVVISPDAPLELALGFSQNIPEVADAVVPEPTVAPEAPAAAVSPWSIVLSVFGVVCLLGSGGLFLVRRR